MDLYRGTVAGNRALLLTASVAVAGVVVTSRFGLMEDEPVTRSTVALAVALVGGAWLMRATSMAWGSDRAGRGLLGSATNAVGLPAAILLPVWLFIGVALVSVVAPSRKKGLRPGALGSGLVRASEMSAAAVVYALTAPSVTPDLSDVRSVLAVTAAGAAMLVAETVLLVHLTRAVMDLDGRELPWWDWEDLAPEVPPVLLGAVFCLVYPMPATFLVVVLIGFSHLALREHIRLRAAARVQKTGLLGWASFESLARAELDRARRTRRPLVLLLMDLDGLKAVNTDHGHLMGDRYIQQMSLLLTEAARVDDLLARFGGDEFCLLLPNTSLAAGATVAERIRARTAATTFGSTARPMSVSVGVAALSAEDDLHSLIAGADRALRQAKANQRNQVVVAS